MDQKQPVADAEADEEEIVDANLAHANNNATAQHAATTMSKTKPYKNDVRRQIACGVCDPSMIPQARPRLNKKKQRRKKKTPICWLHEQGISLQIECHISLNVTGDGGDFVKVTLTHELELEHPRGAVKLLMENNDVREYSSVNWGNGVLHGIECKQCGAEITMGDWDKENSSSSWATEICKCCRDGKIVKENIVRDSALLAKVPEWSRTDVKKWLSSTTKAERSEIAKAMQSLFQELNDKDEGKNN